MNRELRLGRLPSAARSATYCFVTACAEPQGLRSRGPHVVGYGAAGLFNGGRAHRPMRRRVCLVKDLVGRQLRTPAA